MLSSMPAGICDFALDRVQHVAVAVATGAGIFDRRAGPVAGGASRLHAEDARRLDDLSAAAAIAAFLPRGAGLGAAPSQWSQCSCRSN